MKIKIIIVFFFIAGLSFPWGEEGHKLIAGKAMNLLKGKIKNIELYEKYIIEHSIDPDIRRNQDKSEGPKHFIDIDFYKEFLDGKMIIEKDKLVTIYSDSIVTKMGLLPWATLETLNSLQKAFTEQNRDKVLIFAADLAHYVADAHQPMHTMLNYDGQLTDQKGVHARYESIMLERFLNELAVKTNGGEAAYVEEPLKYIFDYIANSNSLGEVLLSSDKFASKRTGSNNSDEYYNLLWFKTKYITEIQFESAVNSLASLIFTAWTDAGKPSLDVIN
jgi:hypothetical protein